MPKRTIPDFFGPAFPHKRPKFDFQTAGQFKSDGWTAEQSDQLFLWHLNRASHYERNFTCDYKAFLQAKDYQFLLSVARKQCAAAFAILDAGKIRDRAAYNSLPYDYHQMGAVIYFASMSDTADLDFWKGYIGQAGTGNRKYSVRENEHHRHSRDASKPASTLLHKIWNLKNTRRCKFAFAAVYTPVQGFSGNDTNIWMNILEQFWCCAFQTLPTLFIAPGGTRASSASGWAPDWLIPEAEEIGLNDRLPIGQGSKSGAKSSGLRYSKDPEVRDAYHKKTVLNAKKSLPLARQAQIYAGYQQVTAGNQQRRIADAAKINATLHWRKADATLGDLLEVKCICTRCNKFGWTDKNPKYSTVGDGYIQPRNARCEVCKADPNYHSPNTNFRPVDPSVPSISAANARRKAQRAQGIHRTHGH